MTQCGPQTISSQPSLSISASNMCEWVNRGHVLRSRRKRVPTLSLPLSRSTMKGRPSFLISTTAAYSSCTRSTQNYWLAQECSHTFAHNIQTLATASLILLWCSSKYSNLGIISKRDIIFCNPASSMWVWGGNKEKCRVSKANQSMFRTNADTHIAEVQVGQLTVLIFFNRIPHGNPPFAGP